MRQTPIKTMSEKRRAELEAKGVNFPTSTFTPRDPKLTVPRQPKRPTDTGPDKATVEIVLKRDHFKCACCGDPLYGQRGEGWCISHRKLRAQGVDNRPSNLMASCMPCERSLHDHPERARQAGWMLRSTEDPEHIPMEHSQHGTVLLLNDGTVVYLKEGAE